MIKRIKIKKMFGTKDVTISFVDGVNIFVGENGIGKTSILNLVYAFMNNDVEMILKETFESIEFYFGKEKGERIIIKREHISFDRKANENVKMFEHKMIYKYHNNMEKISEIIQDLPREVIREKSSKEIRNFIFNTSVQNYEMNPRHMEELITYMLKEKESYFTKSIALRDKIDSEILYFPTFRRIETDLLNINMSSGESSKVVQNKLMRFGMGDVEELLENKLNIITNFIRHGFNKMTTILLKQYTEGNIDRENINIDQDELKTIFGILSDSVPIELQNRLLTMHEQNELSENKLLVNYLDNLMNAYKSQEKNFKAIDNFVNVCNSYMVNKRMIFKKNDMKVIVVDNDHSNYEIKFSKLSSGEKQIVSLFATLYLNDDKKYSILFDEPELSLSIEWQKQLIPDIIKSNRCEFLFAVTHSPFIFDNEFDKNTQYLQDCIVRD